MKKFLAIALIATSFVACNEGETKVEETTTTETVAPVDTVVAPVVADTTVTVDTTIKM